MSADRELALRIPDELVEELAQRVAAILAADSNSSDLAGPDLLTVDEVADVLRTSRQRVYDLVYAGKLAKVKDGARVLVERRALEQYVHGLPTVGSRAASKLRRTQ